MRNLPLILCCLVRLRIATTTTTADMTTRGGNTAPAPGGSSHAAGQQRGGRAPGVGGAAGGGGPATVSVNDLLLSWIAAQKVADNVARVEREAHTLHQKLEETLMRMQGMEVTSATDDGPDGGEDGGADWPTTTTTEGAFTAPRLLINTDADTEDAAAAAATAALLASPIPATPGSPSALLSLPPSAVGPSLPQTRAAALQARRANVNALRQKLDADMVALSQQRATVLAQRQALQPKLALLQSAHATELSHRESLERGARKHLSELRLQLHLTQLRQSFRRRTLLHHLSQIYPIAPPRTALKSSQSQHPLMCFTIRGLRLPNNFNNILTSFEEEQVSTALGYVCHLILMLSKYLEVPEQFPFTPLAGCRACWGVHDRFRSRVELCTHAHAHE